MYRNVDAALHIFEKYSRILVTHLRFEQSKTDPCIFLKYNQQGRLIMIISTHVDDLLIGGCRGQVDAFYVAFFKYLKIEILGKLKKHLGVWWEWLEDPHTKEIYLKATMPKMLQ